MSYAGNFINAYGQDCIIEREMPIETKASIKRSTKASRDLGIRAGYWEGLIPIDTRLLSGEIITISNIFETTQYLVQHTNYDPQSMQIAFFSAKCNAEIKHKRYVKDVDEYNNVIYEWQDVNPDRIDIPCYVEIVNQRTRREMRILLEGTIYLFQVPKSMNVEKDDRFIYNGKPYKVDSIDDAGLDGVDLCQLGQDVRGE